MATASTAATFRTYTSLTSDETRFVYRTTRDSLTDARARLDPTSFYRYLAWKAISGAEITEQDWDARHALEHQGEPGGHRRAARCLVMCSATC